MSEFFGILEHFGNFRKGWKSVKKDLIFHIVL